MDIAVIGAGIAGLSCAWRLGGGRLPGADAGLEAREGFTRVTVFEAGADAGGHSHTVDAEVDGARFPVDTGFLVFNHRTYPQLVRLFEALDVRAVASEMTFSVRLSGAGTRPIEWAGHDLGSVFVQRRNLLDPRFLRMLADLVRFNRQTMAMSRDARSALGSWTLGEFLDAHGYSSTFRDWYLLPMAAAIWSCSTVQMRDFPVSTFVDFCANHGLLQITDRPQWYTVAGGSRSYVERLVAAIGDVRLRSPALGVARVRFGGADKVAVRTASGTTLYDHVVLACHSDQARRLVEAPGRLERQLLGAVRYQPNRAVLHTDASVLPTRRRAWAAWNYQCDVASSRLDDRSVCVHYLINRLQPVPFARPVIGSLNPVQAPAPSTILETFDYAHPVFDGCAINAQRRLAEIQGRGNLWYCGAWTGYGFHEDGLKSGLAVAKAIAATRDVAVTRGVEARLAA